MKHKPIKIDWEALEDAFNNQNEELVYYLDLVSGHVVLEGEGEEDDDDDEDYSIPATAPPPDYNASTRAYVEPPRTLLKVDWMKDFIETSTDLESELVDKLNGALDEDDPAPPIRAALAEHPDGRDSWYLYRSNRIRDLIDDWLEKHKIPTIDPSPWKS